MLTNEGLINDLKRQGKHVRLMQDGASCHKSDYPIKYLSNRGIQTLRDWPPSSPDLNPIENLWGILKNKIEWKENMEREDMMEAATKAWNSIPKRVINNLVDSYEERLKLCEEMNYESINDVWRSRNARNQFNEEDN